MTSIPHDENDENDKEARLIIDSTDIDDYKFVGTNGNVDTFNGSYFDLEVREVDDEWYFVDAFPHSKIIRGIEVTDEICWMVGNKIRDIINNCPYILYRKKGW